MGDQEAEIEASTAAAAAAALTVDIATDDHNADDHEPRLSYDLFGADVAGILGRESATCLCVSDKLLALGTESGAVYLLDYEGNKVKNYQEHSAAVTDLSFDADAETLASSSLDGYVTIYNLYTNDVQRLKCGSNTSIPTTVTLDPRHSHRKTKEFVYGTDTGMLLLSSKGWLGNSETILFQGRGRVHCARMAGTLLAWATESGLRVYNTADHSRIGKIDRPPMNITNRTPTSSINCTLTWVGDRELLVGWGRHVMVLEIVQSNSSTINTNTSIPSLSPRSSATNSVPVTPTQTTPRSATAPSTTSTSSTPPAAMSSSSRQFTLQVVSQFEIQEEESENNETGSTRGVVGVAPFGGHLAVLINNTTSSRNTTSTAAVFKVFDRSGTETFTENPLLNFEEATSTTSQPNLANTIAATRAPLPIIGFTSFYALSDVLKEKSVKSRTPSVPTAVASTSSSPSTESNKWWSDGAEPVYFIISSNSITLGRPRSAPDRIAWLVHRHRYLEAVHIAESDASIDENARVHLGEQYLHYLIGEEEESKTTISKSKEKYRFAAEMCPRLLRKDAAAWERWVYIFGQAAQLPLLSPVIPTADPVLSRDAYDMVLTACLRGVGGVSQSSVQSNDDVPAAHDMLRDLVDRWPHGIYDARALINQIQPRLENAQKQQHRPTSAKNITRTTSISNAYNSSSTSSSVALKRAAASLYAQLGQHDAALRLLLEIRSPSTFDYIKTNALQALAAQVAAELMELDEVKATQLLVDAVEEAPPAAVVASLQAKILSSKYDEEKVDKSSGQEAGNQEGGQEENILGGRGMVCKKQDSPSSYSWSLSLYHYLDWLWQKEISPSGGGGSGFAGTTTTTAATSVSQFSQLHIELCATHDPDRLMHILTTSSSYPLDAALQVCESHGLVRESVYLLGRMGSSDAALRLIVGQLRDVEGAVTFVQDSRDDELWELLISLTLGDAALTGALLDHAGGSVDPLRLVQSIPEDIKIERLRDRLVRVITDFRATVSLQSGCNAVLRADCLELGDALYAELTRALKTLFVLKPGGRWSTLSFDDNSGALSGGGGGGNAVRSTTSMGTSAGQIHDGLPEERQGEFEFSTPQGGFPFPSIGQHQRVWIGSTSTKTSTECGGTTPRGSSFRKMSLTPPPSVHTSPSKYPPSRKTHRTNNNSNVLLFYKI